jgi:translation elongation factor EF-Tu-like GTPase
MPKTRDAAIRAQESGATSIKVLFENIELVGDAELVQLSKLETMELLANHGFSGNRVVFRECMLSC